MSALRLYDEVIKAHNSSPYHFEKISAPISFTSNNPACGDRFDFYVTQPEGKLKLHFHGFGCAVSKASSSVLAQSLEGKTAAEAKEICAQFLTMLNSEIDEEKLFSKEFKSFAIVKKIPARFDCAALPWIELKKYLN